MSDSIGQDCRQFVPSEPRGPLPRPVLSARASRRTLLRLTVLASVGGVLAACTSAAPAAPTAAPSRPTTAPAPTTAPVAKPTTAAAVATPTIAQAAKPASAPTTAPAVIGSASKVTLRLDWKASGYHAPFYLAAAKGYYKDQGLSLDVLEGNGSGVTIKTVGAGSDTFGLAGISTMALAVAEGVPVKAVAGYLQKMPDGILSLAETGIKTPKDLEGKTFAFQPGGSGEVLFPAFAQANGIDESKVKKLTVDSAAKLPTVLTGKADFTVLWGFNDLPVARKQGKNAVFMGFADNGVNVAGHGLFASADTVKNRPEVAKAFVAASVKAIDEAIKNPDVAVDALTQGRPELDKGLLLEQFKGLPDNLRTENSKGKPTSWIAPEDIKQTGELLLKYMDMKKQVPAEDLYTNQFIPLA